MVETGTKESIKKRRFVRRIALIVDLDTGKIVGSQVEWNTGEKRLQWHGERAKRYALRPCAVVSDWPQLEGQG